MNKHECKEYSIAFFSSRYVGDGQTFGCSAADFAAQSGWGSDGESVAAWAIRPRGIVLGGEYAQALSDLRAVFEEGFKPDAAVLLFSKNQGIEGFLAEFSQLAGEIPFCGGGASPLAGGAPPQLVPYAKDVGILLIKDDRYAWSCEWRNFHSDMNERAFVRTSCARTILTVRTGSESQDTPAREWYSKHAAKYGAPENCFEQLALSTDEGYNLHLSPEDGSALHSGADVPADGRLNVRLLKKDAFNRDIADYCARKRRLIFGCAGLRLQVVAAFPAGADSLAGFFHGEVLSCGGKGRLANLMATSLCAEPYTNLPI